MNALRAAAALLSVALLVSAGCGGQGDIGQIKAVVEKADHEQEDAFATHDSSLMQDTSTARNFSLMAQANDAIAQEGAVGIRLQKLEWGDVKVLSVDSATATTWETWDTTLQDGTTMSDRQRNDYRLIKIGGSWKIDEISHPNEGEPGSQGTPRASRVPS